MFVYMLLPGYLSQKVRQCDTGGMNASYSPSARLIYDTLVPLWPDSGSALDWNECFHLLIAVILSAQCTDEQVNKVTPRLFSAYPGVRELADAELDVVEGIVHSTGFYKAKAAHIIATSQMLRDNFGGTVPDTIEELVRLPGVGRKTANLIISVCYGKPGIVVDTHVLRTARRLGISASDDPLTSERMIGASLPESMWTAFSYALNRHGKHICKARKPECTRCPVANLCPSRDSFQTVQD